MLDGKPEWVRCLLLLFLKYFTKHTPAHAKKQAQEVKKPGKTGKLESGKGLPVCDPHDMNPTPLQSDLLRRFSFWVVGMRLNRSFQKKRAFMLRNLEKTFMMAVLSQFWPRKTVKTGFSVSFRQFGKKAGSQQVALGSSRRDDLFKL